MKSSIPNPASKILCNKAGYTLIELMLVCAFIIGLLVFVTIPSIQGMVNNINKTRAADEFVSDFSVARSMAIRYGRPATVAFNVPGPNEYTVTWNQPVETKVVELARFQAGVQFEPNPPGPAAVTPAPVTSWTFSPQGFLVGNAIQGNNIYITDDQANEVFRITASVAGMISVMRFSPTANDWVYK